MPVAPAAYEEWVRSPVTDFGLTRYVRPKYSEDMRADIRGVAMAREVAELPFDLGVPVAFGLQKRSVGAPAPILGLARRGIARLVGREGAEVAGAGAVRTLERAKAVPLSRRTIVTDWAQPQSTRGWISPTRKLRAPMQAPSAPRPKTAPAPTAPPVTAPVTPPPVPKQAPRELPPRVPGLPPQPATALKPPAAAPPAKAAPKLSPQHADEPLPLGTPPKAAEYQGTLGAPLAPIAPPPAVVPPPVAGAAPVMPGAAPAPDGVPWWQKARTWAQDPANAPYMVAGAGGLAVGAAGTAAVSN